MYSNTDYLAVIGYYDNDVSWAKKLNFPHIIYYKDQPDKEPFNAVNKGKGETNTLKFIYEFYDDLPKNLIQLHQYEYKYYHDGSIVNILNNPNLETKYQNSLTPGFLNLNNLTLEAIDFHLPKMIKSGWWQTCMFEYFGKIEDCGNFMEGRKACAQFIVSRDRIRSLPKSFYYNLYHWIINNTLDDENPGIDPVTLTRLWIKNWDDPNSNWYTSRYMEWSWELIFTSVKSTDLPTKFLNGKSIQVLYGYKNYYLDVTDRFLKLIGDGKFKKGNLNKYFGDANCGYLKTLRIVIDGVTLELDEEWNLIF